MFANDKGRHYAVLYSLLMSPLSPQEFLEFITIISKYIGLPQATFLD
jgi:hypothetical protein